MNVDRQCGRCKELSQCAETVIANIVRLTTSQLAAFREQKMSAFMALDKELELAVGEKERAVGALREHRRQHENEIALGTQ